MQTKDQYRQKRGPVLHSWPAAEARGDWATAVASYKLALRLLLVARDPDACMLHPPTIHAIQGTSTSLQTGTCRSQLQMHGHSGISTAQPLSCTHAAGLPAPVQPSS